jgi:hypothetical protein
MNGSSCCFTFGSIIVLDFVYSSVYLYLIMVLLWNSLMTWDVKHFICVFAICVSSLLEIFLWTFFYFLVRFSTLYLLTFKSSLHILENSPSSLCFVFLCSC